MFPLTLSFVFVLITGSYAASSLFEFDPQDVIACALSQGITNELLEGITYGNPEELYDHLPEARCFLACVLRKMGQFVGDDDSPVIKELQEKFAAVPQVGFDVIIEACKPKPDELDDGTCMKEYKAFTCFAAKLQEVAHKIEEENLAECGIDDVPESWEPGMAIEDKTDTGEKKEEKEEDKTKEQKKADVKKKPDEKKKADDKKKPDDKKKSDDKKKPDVKVDKKEKKTEL